MACLASVHAGLEVLFGPALRRTTLLLWGIWLANAGTYYGLVLLTTALQTAAKHDPCTPEGRPNLDASDYLVGREPPLSPTAQSSHDAVPVPCSTFFKKR